MNKTDALKKRIYEIIEVSNGKDKTSKLYDCTILIAVIVGLIPLTMKAENPYTKLIDLMTGIVFICDYSLRLYTSDYKMGIKSYKAYLYYGFTPLAIIDLLSFIPIIAHFIPSLAIMRLFRIFRVFQVLKLIRYSKAMRTIENVLRKVKSPLLAVLILTVIYITASAMLIFQLEPDIFNSFFDALYWATISITTIGYGDISPVTSVGRFMTMVSALVGVAIIALPSGIITAAYMEEIKKKKSALEL